jgi:hypothetical protein
MKIKKNINSILIGFVLLAAFIYFYKKQNVKEGAGVSDVINYMKLFSNFIEKSKSAIGPLEAPLKKEVEKYVK